MTRPRRTVGSIVAALTALLAAASMAPATAESRWPWPLSPAPTLARAFEPPASDYGAGHRGIDLRAAAGQSVLSATTGSVTVAGSVAGRGVVVVRSGPHRLTYEPVLPLVAVGDRVEPGDVVGRVDVTGSHCFPDACLHVGLRRGDQYLDPLPHFGPQQVRLKPLGGDPAAGGTAGISAGPSGDAGTGTGGSVERTSTAGSDQGSGLGLTARSATGALAALLAGGLAARALRRRGQALG